MDGIATAAHPPSNCPVTRRSVPPLPLHIQSRSVHTGKRVAAAARWSTCTRGAFPTWLFARYSRKHSLKHVCPACCPASVSSLRKRVAFRRRAPQKVPSAKTSSDWPPRPSEHSLAASTCAPTPAAVASCDFDRPRRPALGSRWSQRATLAPRRGGDKTPSGASRNAGDPACTPARSRRAATSAHCEDMADLPPATAVRNCWPPSSRLHAPRPTMAQQRTSIDSLWILHYSPRGRRTPLFAEAGLHGNPLATLGTTPRQNLGPALGLHPRAESMFLGALTSVGLESTFGHEKSLLLIRSIA